MKKSIAILMFMLPAISFAAGTEQELRTLDGAYSRAFYCNQAVESSITFSDEPHRLLYAVDMGGFVEWDGVLAIHQTYKNLATGFSNTWQEARFGNAGCNERGSSGNTTIGMRRVFYDADPPNVDSVTITGQALEKTPAGSSQSSWIVGFRGPTVIATYRLCDDGQITNRGECKNISGVISSDKSECGANCAPTISWSSEYAVNVSVTREHDGKQIGSGPVGSFTDSGLRNRENI